MRLFVYILLLVSFSAKAQPSAFYNNLSQDQIVTAGLVLYLDANKTASYNGSGNWNNLTGGTNTSLVNSPTFTHSASNGAYFSFTNSATSYANTNSSFSSTLSGSFTFCAEVKVGTLYSDNDIMGIYNTVGAVSPNYGRVAVLDATASYLQSIFFSTTNNVYYQGGTYASGWHYIAWTVNESTNTLVFYLDGVAVSTKTFTGTIASTDSNIYIGYYPINGDTWDWSCANVQIYNRALSATEVAQNYNAFHYQYSH